MLRRQFGTMLPSFNTAPNKAVPVQGPSLADIRNVEIQKTAIAVPDVNKIQPEPETTEENEEEDAA
jgi:hypothetical protein